MIRLATPSKILNGNRSRERHFKVLLILCTIVPCFFFFNFDECFTRNRSDWAVWRVIRFLSVKSFSLAVFEKENLCQNIHTRFTSKVDECCRITPEISRNVCSNLRRGSFIIVWRLMEGSLNIYPSKFLCKLWIFNFWYLNLPNAISRKAFKLGENWKKKQDGAGRKVKGLLKRCIPSFLLPLEISEGNE